MIEEMLDRLANLKDQQAVVAMEKDERIKAAIPPEVQAEIDRINAEYTVISAKIDVAIEELEEEVRQYVISQGKSVKAARIMAVYNKGRVTWDTRGLDVWAMEHPEIERFKKVGQPYITFRSV